MKTILSWSDEDHEEAVKVLKELSTRGFHVMLRYDGVYTIDLKLNLKLVLLLGVDVGIIS